MTRSFRALRAAAPLALAVGLARPASAQTGANVLVVANADSAPSVEIASYYAEKRHVPPDQVLKVAMPTVEEVPRATFESKIERPIAEWLAAHFAQDRILYIVLTKGVPIRVAGTVGMQGTVASVDSELTLLYRRFAQVSVSVPGSIANPYFLGPDSIAGAKPFTHREQDLYLVTRLDGFTTADAKALVDRSLAASKEGRILLDEKPALTDSPGNTWLKRAATELEAMPGWRERVVLDTGIRVLQGEQNVLGYYSWGSNDPVNFKRHLSLGFVPGAVGGTFVSTDARTFEEPPAEWSAGKSFKGSSQSLVGDLIREGITGVAGHVAEPYLNATIRPDILFPAYVSGMNLAEAFYLAMPFVSWQTVVVGDPLCAPFRQKGPVPSDLDPGTDPIAEQPLFLTERLVAGMVKAGVRADAARLFIKSQTRAIQRDRDGARQALEQTVAADPAFAGAQIALGLAYEADGQWARAIDAYRRGLERAPDHTVALNNLAYLLALHKPDQRAEALEMAKRAYAGTNGNPVMADTLAWIYHLLGNDASAEPLIESAVKGAPKNADVQLHAAFVFAAVGKMQPAAEALTAALALDKTLATREDVRGLRSRLKLAPQ